VCTHDHSTGQLQLLDTFMQSESFQLAEGCESDAQQPMQTEEGVPLPPSLQAQQHRCDMELAEIKRLKKEYEIAMRADESPVIRSDLDEQLAAWKNAKMRIDSELIKQDPQVVQAKAQQTAVAAGALELPSLPLPNTTSADSSETDISPRRTPQRTLSFGDWTFISARAEEAQPPFDQWGRPRGHFDYGVDPHQLLIENSDGDSSEDDVSTESDDDEEEDEDDAAAAGEEQQQQEEEEDAARKAT
jgi:hypothetical protein